MVEAEQFLKLTELSVFMLILTWQLLLARRHAALHFSLISLSITNEDELVATYGMLKTEQLTLEFFERIRVLLRDSDLIARDDNVLVFLLPMTPAQNCITLLERIQSFTQKQQVGNLNIKINLTMMHSSELLEKNISKDLVLNELYNSELKKL
ncbi:diguanylate cyclase domain-containing protein [Legionella longbeachae]|nr:diguanylate cyclase [Legionella longbeachae]